jgi:FHA domain
MAAARGLGLAAGPAPGYAGPPAGGSPPVSGTNGIVVTGALWWKKHLCAQCGQQLDRSWDRCPFCKQGQGLAASVRTQAMRVDAAGVGSGMQLCGWLVAVKGAQRGELYTLEPVTSIGTDPACTIVLTDRYMSARHCEIRAEGGSWMLRDLKSTNGTYVNDKRTEQHELVDSDFLRLGECVLKFKSL